MPSLLDPAAPLTDADIVTMLADFGRACLEDAAKPSPDTERAQLEAGARIIKAITRANPDLSPGGSSPSDTIDSLKAELETANEARRQAQR